MTANSNRRKCPDCGDLVPLDAPAGLCPRCALARAAVETDTGVSPNLRSDPPTLAEVATAFPELEVAGFVGGGGMGFVFRVRQRDLGKEAALKILPRHLASDPSFVERFTREAQTLSRLHHSHIVGVYDFGQKGGFCYLMMEFVDGANLRQAMRAGRFSSANALSIIPEICDALQYAHGQGVLHRDIKPENILLDSHGHVKIVDFGIAKILGDSTGTPADITLTQSGVRLGTPHYMAPEQIEKPGQVDHRADIYSLGVVFYELLTGELPLGRFPAPSEIAVLDARIDAIVFRALAKERALRQQSAGEVRTQVESLSAPGTASTGRDSVKSSLSSNGREGAGSGSSFARKAAFFLPILVILMALTLILFHPNLTLDESVIIRWLVALVAAGGIWLKVFSGERTESSRKAIIAGIVGMGLLGLLLYFTRPSPSRSAQAIAAAMSPKAHEIPPRSGADIGEPVVVENSDNSKSRGSTPVFSMNVIGYMTFETEKETGLSKFLSEKGVVPGADSSVSIVRAQGGTEKIDVAAIGRMKSGEPDIALHAGDKVTVTGRISPTQLSPANDLSPEVGANPILSAPKRQLFVIVAGAMRGRIKIPASGEVWLSDGLLELSPSAVADLKKVRVNRKDGQVLTVDVKNIWTTNNRAADLVLKPGDQVFIPEKLLRF